ncbi:MAG: TraR/DksA C4-type zinc finger protein [Candidatus Roizmanbacteria bacterium]|nr:TraR/DksA C4-type zinc finger protein [Candidatus Roizmanbacteria bacterium]
MSKQLSKTFLAKQKNIIEEEQKKLTLQIEELKKEDPFSDPSHASDNAAVDTDVREQVGHDTVEAEIKDATKRLVELKTAQELLKKDRYGICERCSKDIPQARLELVPEARYCIECKKALSK